MGKYGELSRNDGHSKWFLQRTIIAHDSSMNHPWMQMIYNQNFSVQQYCAWLAMNHASFKALEQYQDLPALKNVQKPHLLRTAPLEADLLQLQRSKTRWQDEVQQVVSSSKATQRYLSHLAEDAEKQPLLVLAHHFLQYNAVLSGGAFLAEMVSQKLCIPLGGPGVQFYAFDGVGHKKTAAEVQRYMRDLDTIEIGEEEERQLMLKAMNRLYDDVRDMMQECYELNPQSGIAFGAAKDEFGNAMPPPRIPDEELLQLSLSELQGYNGRIIMSLAGELLDVTAGSDLYGPGNGYGLLAGHDVTRCLATMSLEPEHLDDLEWTPTTEEDEAALKNWRDKLKAKYPVAGMLRRENGTQVMPPLGLVGPPEGLRQRSSATAAPAMPAAAPAPPKPAAGAGAATTDADQKCPMSGKTGVGCPMAMFAGGGAAKAAPKAAPKAAAAQTGFMKGKSMISAVSESKGEAESFFFKLCPLHWDANTTRLLIAVGVAAWVSGIFVGWNLNRQWIKYTAS